MSHDVPKSSTFACPHCKQHIKAGAAMAGETVTCPSCERALLIPHTVPLKVLPPSAHTPLPRSSALRTVMLVSLSVLILAALSIVAVLLVWKHPARMADSMQVPSVVRQVTKPKMPTPESVIALPSSSATTYECPLPSGKGTLKIPIPAGWRALCDPQAHLIWGSNIKNYPMSIKGSDGKDIPIKQPRRTYLVSLKNSGADGEHAECIVEGDWVRSPDEYLDGLESLARGELISGMGRKQVAGGAPLENRDTLMSVCGVQGPFTEWVSTEAGDSNLTDFVVPFQTHSIAFIVRLECRTVDREKFRPVFDKLTREMDFVPASRE